MKSIAIVFGTRPEVIKLAPVVEAFRASERYKVVAISTGQHREMLKQAVDLFNLKLDYEMQVMRPNQSLAGLTARLIEGLDEFLSQQKPDLVLTQGDTTTVLATALCCYYRNIPVGHVEAGLRTGNLRNPFPEEANRCLTAALATLHFAPTASAASNLERVGIPKSSVFVTGNTVTDALRIEVKAQSAEPLKTELLQTLSALLGQGWQVKRLVLITGHRRENFGRGMQSICNALIELATNFPDVLYVYPVHLNPNVQSPVLELLKGRDNIRLIEPQPYRVFVALMQASYIILTDSGGIQEEAPTLGKPVLVMRATTERPEGLIAGTARIVGAEKNSIVSGVSELLTQETAYRRMSSIANPYGDGFASTRILEAVDQFFGPQLTNDKC